MDNEKRQAMIDKIVALLAKAEDRGCTPAESEAFFAKAQELMTKWAIDEELLKMSGKKTDDVIKSIVIKIATTYYLALVGLWDGVARANDCRVLMRKPDSVIVIGYESDLARVQLLVTSLQLFATREAQAESKKCGGDYYFRRAFISSFASRIGARLREQRDLNVAQHSNPGVGVALRDKRDLVNEYIGANYSVGRGRASRQRGHAAGSAAGRSAANRADLGNTRIGGSRGALNR